MIVHPTHHRRTLKPPGRTHRVTEIWSERRMRHFKRPNRPQPKLRNTYPSQFRRAVSLSGPATRHQYNSNHRREKYTGVILCSTCLAPLKEPAVSPPLRSRQDMPLSLRALSAAPQIVKCHFGTISKALLSKMHRYSAPQSAPNLNQR